MCTGGIFDDTNPCCYDEFNGEAYFCEYCWDEPDYENYTPCCYDEE